MMSAREKVLNVLVDAGCIGLPFGDIQAETAINPIQLEALLGSLKRHGKIKNYMSRWLIVKLTAQEERRSIDIDKLRVEAKSLRERCNYYTDKLNDLQSQLQDVRTTLAEITTGQTNAA